MRTIKPGMYVVTALVVATLAAGALASQGAPAADAKVQIDQYAFLPQRITVKAGTTVTWTNDDDDSHTVASNSKLFKSKALDTGDKFSFTLCHQRHQCDAHELDYILTTSLDYEKWLC